MLSPKDKEEMLADAHNPQRAKDFAAGKKLTSDRKMSTQEFMAYLTKLTANMHPDRTRKTLGKFLL